MFLRREYHNILDLPMSKKNKEASISLHPLSFEEAMKELSRFCNNGSKSHAADKLVSYCPSQVVVAGHASHFIQKLFQ